VAETRAETRTQKLSSDVADAILRGEFEPGARLDEQMLAARFGVSRTPVREVLRELAASGLVEMRPRRGAIVARIGAEELDVLFGAMAEVEATCARLAALVMTPIERRRLEALHERMAALVGADDEAAYADANLRFHSAIYEGAHNPVIADFAIGLRRRLAPFRRAQFHTDGRLNRSHVEHAAVVAAILDGDAALAHAAMLHHVALVEDAFERLAATTGA